MILHRILVTGASGLLGTGFRGISHAFPDRRFIWADSTDCDLTDLEATVNFVAKCQPDGIVHLAALAGGISYSMSHPATLLRDNVRMDLNVLEAARIAGIKKTIMTLSVGMYPENSAIPISEREIHLGRPHESNYSYAFAKRLIEPAIRAWRTEYQINVIGLVVNGIFGENANFSPEQSVMLTALIRRFYEARAGNDPLLVWGDGLSRREYTYSQDLARAYMWCLDHYDSPEIINIGSTEEYSVKEMAFMVAESLDVDTSRISFDKSRPSGTRSRATDNSRFLALSGFQYTPFKTGLNRTVKWFCDNYSVPGAVRL